VRITRVVVATKEGHEKQTSYISEDEEKANLFEDIEEHVLIGETRKENKDEKDE
jgi:hypothetical protein